MCTPLLLASFLTLPVPLASPVTSPVGAGDDFDRTWFDGRAEVAGYRWSGTRYGELRRGEAVAIFVTEPFDAERHVKVDDPSRHDGEVLTAFKLNLVRDFQTGLYDYNTMVSAFLDARSFDPLKLTFSSAEWCGHVFEEVDVRRAATRVDTRSYFEGESGQRELKAPAGGVIGEQLFVLLRGLRGPYLEPGGVREVPFLSSSFERRLRHIAPRWGTARITRAKEDIGLVVPAGKFQAQTYRVEASDGRTALVHVEAAAPHRLLLWEWKRGEIVLDRGELTGSERLRYWELHGEGDERVRGKSLKLTD